MQSRRRFMTQVRNPTLLVGCCVSLLLTLRSCFGHESAQKHMALCGCVAALILSMHGAVWLGTYPDGALRSGSQDDRRIRHKLAPLQWFRQKLVATGGADLDKQSLNEMSSLFRPPLPPLAGSASGHSRFSTPLASLPVLVRM